ncbi:hypothetical protein BSKO_07873 [Bryopsis sp. KO-2023]|nr:hypothetical protein BSKO_07873 [Bryopsis sp. KO-2023]
MRKSNPNNPPGASNVNVSSPADLDVLMRRMYHTMRQSPLASVDPFDSYQRAPVCDAPGLHLPVPSIDGTSLQGCPRGDESYPPPEYRSQPCMAMPVPERTTPANPIPSLHPSAFSNHVPQAYPEGVRLFGMESPPATQEQEVPQGEKQGFGAALETAAVKEEPLEADAPEEIARKRVEARKERNRRAQRTFRQRQKSRMLELEGEVERLSARLEFLKSNNSSLQANVSLLHKVLQVREEQLMDLQRRQDSHDMQESQHKQFLSAFPEFSFGMELSLVEEDGCKVTVTPGFVSTLSMERAKSIWLMYGKEICRRVESASQQMQGNDSAATRETIRLSSEIGCLLFLFILADPSNLPKMKYAVEMDMKTHVDPVEATRKVIEKMNYDDEQKLAIARKWRWLIEVYETKTEESARCQQTLNSGVCSLTSVSKLSAEYIRHCEVVGRMKELVLERHEAEMNYIYEVVGKVIRPEQAARLFASCFPYPPQYFIMGDLLAAGLGESDLPSSTVVDEMVIPSSKKSLSSMGTSSESVPTSMVE